MILPVAILFLLVQTDLLQPVRAKAGRGVPPEGYALTATVRGLPVRADKITLHYAARTMVVPELRVEGNADPDAAKAEIRKALPRPWTVILGMDDPCGLPEGWTLRESKGVIVARPGLESREPGARLEIRYHVDGKQRLTRMEEVLAKEQGTLVETHDFEYEEFRGRWYRTRRRLTSDFETCVETWEYATVGEFRLCRKYVYEGGLTLEFAHPRVEMQIEDVGRFALRVYRIRDYYRSLAGTATRDGDSSPFSWDWARGTRFDSAEFAKLAGWIPEYSPLAGHSADSFEESSTVEGTRVRYDLLRKNPTTEDLSDPARLLELHLWAELAGRIAKSARKYGGGESAVEDYVWERRPAKGTGIFQLRKLKGKRGDREYRVEWEYAEVDGVWLPIRVTVMEGGREVEIGLSDLTGVKLK